MKPAVIIAIAAAVVAVAAAVVVIVLMTASGSKSGPMDQASFNDEISRIGWAPIPDAYPNAVYLCSQRTPSEQVRSSAKLRKPNASDGDLARYEALVRSTC